MMNDKKYEKKILSEFLALNVSSLFGDATGVIL
jgi:hypothetical protein